MRLCQEGAEPVTPRLSSGSIFLAVLIAVLPAFSGTLGTLPRNVDLTTIMIGVAALMAIVFRVHHKLAFRSVTGWKRSLRLTHTAFALGCIPAVILVLIHPQALYLLSKPSAGGAAAQVSVSWWWFVLQVSVWAGLTEELIFRGLLVSTIRRWPAFHSQRARDLFAVTLSGIIFGLGHLSSWGPWMSLALVGLGMGLGIAYIAIGERLLPIVVYHIVFDALSLTAAMMTYRM